MFFLGQKELGEKTGNKLYDDLNELSDLAFWQIVYWAAMNPRLRNNARNNLNPKPADTKSIAQKALLPKIQKIMDGWSQED